MDQIENLADSRLLGHCVYCGGKPTSRDHVPSKILLDEPYPENLPVVEACVPCNNGFSRDEEYLASLVEVAVAGSTDPSRIRRPRVARVLAHSPALRAELERARSDLGVQPAPNRVKPILRKLALGHAAFELSVSPAKEPSSIRYRPLHKLGGEALAAFTEPHASALFGEVGCRATQRLAVTQIDLMSAAGDVKRIGAYLTFWIEVQAERYRYQAIHDEGGVTVRYVIGDYLACEVHWDDGYG